MLVGAVLIKQRGGQRELFSGRCVLWDDAEMFGDQARAEVAGDKVRVLEQVDEQALIGRHAE